MRAGCEMSEIIACNHKINNQATIVDKVVKIAKRCWESPNHLEEESRSVTCNISTRVQVKNIAIFFPSLGIGGGERVVRFLINLFQDMGISPIILTNVPIQNPKNAPSLPETVKRFVLPDSETIQCDNYRSRASALYDVLVDNNVDAFIFAHWYIKTLAYDALIAKGLGISTHLYIQSSFPLLFLDDDLPPRRCDIPFSYRIFDTVICLSEMDKLFWEHFNDNVRVTYNPLTITPALRDPSKLDGHTVIWPARLNADKCPERVIPIMQKLAERVPDAKLIMVGPVEDGYRLTFLQLAEKYGVRDRIELVGSQQEESMEKWYRQADAFLLTSKREGWSLALGEALAMGVPAVIYDLPYLTLARCKAVTSIPQGDSIAAANALARLLIDKPFAHRMASIGLNFISSIASYDHKAFWKSCLEIDADDIENTANNAGETSIELSRLMWRELFESFWSHSEHNAETIRKQQETIFNLKEDLANAHAIHQQEIQRLTEWYENSKSLIIGRALTKIPRAIKASLKTESNRS